MATFLDISFFEGLTPILVLLIVFAIVYGVLSASNIFGGSRSLNAIIAFVIGIIMMFSSKLVQVIMVMIPWFMVIALFMVLMVIGFKTLGMPDSALQEAVQNRSLYWVFIVIGLILLVASIATVYGQEELSVTKENVSQVTFSGDNGDTEVAAGTNTADYQQNAKATIYHPRMLGFILIIIIGVFAVQQLTRDA